MCLIDMSFLVFWMIFLASLIPKFLMSLDKDADIFILELMNNEQKDEIKFLQDKLDELELQNEHLQQTIYDLVAANVRWREKFYRLQYEFSEEL